jgi:hypothetical protein
MRTNGLFASLIHLGGAWPGYMDMHWIHAVLSQKPPSATLFGDR